MIIKDFFRLYQAGDFEENALSNCVTKKIKIINEPQEKIKTDIEEISLYKQWNVRKQHEKLRTYYCWSNNKLFHYKKKMFTNEHACVYDFLACNQDKLVKRNAFYAYEPIFERERPIGVVVGVPSSVKEDNVAYIFYLLDKHTLNIDANNLGEAKEKAYDLIKAYTEEIKKFQEKSNCIEE